MIIINGINSEIVKKILKKFLNNKGKVFFPIIYTLPPDETSLLRVQIST